MKYIMTENKVFQGKVILAGQEAPAEWRDKPFVRKVEEKQAKKPKDKQVKRSPKNKGVK